MTEREDFLIGKTKLTHENIEDAYFLTKEKKVVFEFNVDGVASKKVYDRESFEQSIGDLLADAWAKTPDSELVENKPGVFTSKGKFNPTEEEICKVVLEFLKDYL